MSRRASQRLRVARELPTPVDRVCKRLRSGRGGRRIRRLADARSTLPLDDDLNLDSLPIAPLADSDTDDVVICDSDSDELVTSFVVDDAVPVDHEHDANDDDRAIDYGVANEARSELANLRDALALTPFNAFRCVVGVCATALLDVTLDLSEPMSLMGPAAWRIWTRTLDACKNLAHSAAWTKRFAADINWYPSMELHDHECVMDVGVCEVCNRNDRQLSQSVRFSGEPYFVARLHDFDCNGDELAECMLDLRAHSADPSLRHYLVGNACSARVELYHALRHHNTHLLLLIEEHLRRQSADTRALSSEARVGALLDNNEGVWKSQYCALESLLERADAYSTERAMPWANAGRRRALV